MFRLKVIAGAQVGKSFKLGVGETSIGRQDDNVIVLNSTQVSKKHCVIKVANGGQILVEDRGSSNGTYVNGALVSRRRIQLGDQISVGDTIFELKKQKDRGLSLVPSSDAQGLMEVDAADLPEVPAAGADLDGLMSSSDWKARVSWAFETYVMPFFYGLNLKQEWKILCLSLSAAFLFGVLIISIYPLLKASHETIIKESSLRASIIARQIAQNNAGYLASGLETKTGVGTFGNEEGVRFAVIADLDSRIIAPSTKMNQYLRAGVEANLLVKASRLYRQGKETGIAKQVDDSTVVAIEPVKILDPNLGKNVVTHVAVVAIDTSLSSPGWGTIGLVYAQALVLSILLGFVIVWILYRLTLKPFEVLNDDLDRVLKGELGQITKDFKWQELNPIWDVLNSMAQRLPRDAGAAGSLMPQDPLATPAGLNLNEFQEMFAAFGSVSKCGLVICDENRKVVYLNSYFEDVSGIRLDEAANQEFSSVARDQAFISLINELFEQSKASLGRTFSEEFDFSGIVYKVRAVALGNAAMVQGYCFVIFKEEVA